MSNRTALWCVIFVAFALRAAIPLVTVLVSQDPALFSAPDSSTYIKPAQELLSHGRFYANGSPELFRTPGYPVFLIPGVLRGNIEAVTIALQILLSCLTTLIVYRISLILFENHRVAILSASLYVVELLSVLYASKILSETVFTFVSTLFLYCLVRYYNSRSLKVLTCAAIMLSASVYVWPANYFLPMLISLLLAVWSFVKERRVSSLTPAVSCLFIHTRRTVAAQEPHRGTAQRVFYGLTSTSIAIRELRFLQRLRRCPTMRCSGFSAPGRSNTLLFIQGSSHLFLSSIYLAVSLFGAAWAVLHMRCVCSISIVSLLCVLSYQLLVSGGPVGYHRFRVPMMPLISLLTGYGLHILIAKTIRRS